MLVELKSGMYVRCSIELEFPEKPRRFAVGQITQIKPSTLEVKVNFYMHHDQEELYEVYTVPKSQIYDFDHVKRVKILPQSPVDCRKPRGTGTVLAHSHTDADGYEHYFVELMIDGKPSIHTISEELLAVPFTRGDIDVLDMIENYEFHNPIWYLRRQIVTDSLHTLKNATFGFETLIGSRVFLMQHQVDTIVRAISEDPCRFMLADEVGLGKTIEAAVIMKGIQQRFGDIRILLIVPESLVYQWKNELSFKFWTEFTVFDESVDVSDVSLLIFPLEKLQTKHGKRVLGHRWGLCIIDETHRLLHLEKEYEAVFHLSNRVPHLLLLSATPIQSRQTEFLKLVALLEPKKYGNMSEQEFEILLEKQAYLRKRVYRMMRDLPDYIEDELAEDFVEDLQEIAERLGDSIFTGIVEQIDINSHDQGLSYVKLALAYIGEHYQIERKVIRHRRKEIEHQLSKRRLTTIVYDMKGADVSYYENDAYQAVLDYLEFMNGKQKHLVELALYHRLFLSAVFSSPWALLQLVRVRKQIGEMLQANVSVPYLDLLKSVPYQPDEVEYLRTIEYYTENWSVAAQRELEHLEECYDDPDLIQGRLMKVLDYILSETDQEKIVLFSQWKETITALERVLIGKFGKEAVRSFYSGKSEQQLQTAVDDFQNNPDCRFMLCDPLGGEGRNFQIADRIIHLDLPWNPSDLEQRIGRLDRIGRKQDVLSVVVYAEQTLEEDLFTIWKEGLQIFDESLSGIEIALYDIQKSISEAIQENVRYGLQQVLPEMTQTLERMRTRVEEERYFDMARQLDIYVQEQLMRLIQKFDDDGGRNLSRTMMEWASMTGLNGISGENGNVVIFRKDKTSINSMKRTLFVLPDTSEALKRAKRIGEVRGTFIREVAVAREGLVFYTPGDPFFDSIVNNAYETDWGRCTALQVNNTPFDWEGIVYTWSVSINAKELLKRKEPLEFLVHAQGYTPLEHFQVAESFQPEQAIHLHEVLSLLRSGIPRKNIVHLGKRSNKSVDSFMKEYPYERWSTLIRQTYETGFSKFQTFLKEGIDVKRAKEDFQRKINAMKASNLYYNKNQYELNKIERLEQIYEALLTGLVQPEIRLESAAYIKLVKSC